MKVNQWLQSSTEILSSKGIASARLDCLILLEDALKKDRGWLLAHPETPLQGTTLQKLKARIERRAKHEPLAYIRGKTEFYGREFMINHSVLEPRPESETIITLLRSVVSSRQSSVTSIVDVGTGSGALAITAKLEIPSAQVVATDIDPNCLKVARKNARDLGATIELLEGDLLLPIPSTLYHLPSTILANLPYVPDTWHINQAAMHEPRQAIFGGPDGLDLYRRMFEQIEVLDSKPEFVLTESLPPQHEALAAVAAAHHYQLDNTEDFIQVFKNTL